MIGAVDTGALASAMAEAGVARLELTGPDYALVLDRQGAAAPAPQPAPDLVPVLAPALGHVLLGHSLHDHPLVAEGDAVVAGQPMALLRVGPMLTPVTAPAAGVVAAILAQEGALVGYGARLFDLFPDD